MLDRREDALTGAPFEVAVLCTVQRAVARPPVVGAARGLSHTGEHAAGWIALGALGAALDRPRRHEWGTAVAGVVAAHGASIVLKRIVRRRRPHDLRVQVNVGTPSRLSFPSSHATSTTTAALLYGELLRRHRRSAGLTAAGTALPALLVPAMALSRLVLGVHYPTDVLAGSALGATCALGARRAVRRGRIGRWRTA